MKSQIYSISEDKVSTNAIEIILKDTKKKTLPNV